MDCHMIILLRYLNYFQKLYERSCGKCALVYIYVSILANSLYENPQLVAQQYGSTEHFCLDLHACTFFFLKYWLMEK